MKKIALSLIILFSFTQIAIAQDNILKIDNSSDSFTNAPSQEDIEKILDPNLRYCEEIFLKAYMRREFTKAENEKCRELFTARIEAEINYKKEVMTERWVY